MSSGGANERTISRQVKMAGQIMRIGIKKKIKEELLNLR